MKIFLIIIMGLAIDKWFSTGKNLRRWQWFDGYVSHFFNLLAQWKLNINVWTFSAFLLIPLAIFLLVYWFISIWVFGLIGFLLGIAIFWYSLGWMETFDENNDPNVTLTESLLPVEHAPDIFWRSHERIFAIIFWVILLGPLGIVLYRLVGLTVINAAIPSQWRDYAARVHGVLAWVPARLLGFAYVLAGNFAPAFRTWCEYAVRPGYSRELLTQCGLAALRSAGEVQEIEQASSLVARALGIWLVIIAVFTLGYIWY